VPAKSSGVCYIILSSGWLVSQQYSIYLHTSTSTSTTVFIILISATPYSRIDQLTVGSVEPRITLASLHLDYWLDRLSFWFQYDRWCHTVTLALIKHDKTGKITIQCDSSVWLSSEDCKVWNNQRRNYHQVWNPAHWGRSENPTTTTTPTLTYLMNSTSHFSLLYLDSNLTSHGWRACHCRRVSRDH